jgi:hypothetical protein
LSPIDFYWRVQDVAHRQSSGLGFLLDGEERRPETVAFDFQARKVLSNRMFFPFVEFFPNP